MWGNLAGLRGQCLSKYALNFKCRNNFKQTGHKQILIWIRSEANVIDLCGYTLRYRLANMQIQTWIHADKNRDTCRFKQNMSRY